MAVTGLVVGCVNDVDGGDVMGVAGTVLDASTAEGAMTSKCASGATVKGIDVSYYQGDINWSRVANDGVKFAFIRVSDGLGYHDSKFGQNWSGAKAHGVLRGAYQFFRSNEDPIAQADYLISKVGHLGADDLAPVIDVESTDGQSAHTIATKVKRWLDRVHEKLGVNGIVYTGPYFWSGSVGGADLNDHPLFVAHYGTQCPLVPPTWNRWTFHQFTSSAGIAGISGGVDEDHFNGTLAQLKNMTAGPDLPHACVSGHFHGAFCDDDGTNSEADHDTLKRQLGVNFHCGDVAGSPAFCGNSHANRSQMIFVLGAAAKMPLAGHNNAFHDDNGNHHEDYLNAAQDYGIMVGSNGNVNPDGIADRNQVATVLYRMYALPDSNHDYFFDDDGDANEHVHNAVAAAGLMTGYVEPNRTRRAFKGGDKATRSTLATVAVRAHQNGLVPVWKIPGPCVSKHFQGAFCDDDGTPGAAANHDRLVGELGVDFGCGKLAGSPTFCADKKVTRAEVAYVFEKAAGVPLANLPDAFHDDDNSHYEKYLNAAKAFGIFNGFANGDVRPNEIANRDTLAIALSRLYVLPDATQDYFSDDNGSPNEAWHNKVGEAGLIAGYDDGHGGRKFEGSADATRDMLATLAARAADHGLIPIWLQP